MTADDAAIQCSMDNRCINTIRTLSIDAIQKANSGHPGAPMGMAAAGYVLWTRILKHHPKNPFWHDRDRFVLSAGHASMLLYSLLYLTGYELTLDDIMNFRQWGSKTPGHPEYGLTPGVETSTGPLGQGFANAVGMAMAERHLAAVYNRPGFDIVDHHTYVLCGDGDLMEGISSEAASLAGHLGLGKLICIYDDNRISIEGETQITFTESVATRFKAYNWQVLNVEEGNDSEAIEAALDKAKKETGQPSLIILRTHIAYGSPNKQGLAAAHGAPLGKDEVCLTKQNLGCPMDQDFCVPEDVMRFCRECGSKGAAAEAAWNDLLKAYAEKYPEPAQQWRAAVEGVLPEGWAKDLPVFDPADGPMATRSASGKAINALAGNVPSLVGGSADLAPSNNTYINASHDFQKESYDGRNFRFGVREHAMAAIASGMALHKGVRPFAGTFLVFADYMRPSIRMAALMKLPVIYVFTHDSIAVGEDGPTHQPVEHMASLRAIPGLTVLRPADGNETVQAWRLALETVNGPVAMVLSRQSLPILEDRAGVSIENLRRGAYVLSGADDEIDIILIATGAEVHPCMEAAARLTEKNVRTRVVGMPSWELFERTTADYRDSILPPQVTKRLVVEAGIPMGWERYAGRNGHIIGMTGFGASAPGSMLLEKFGFTADNIVKTALDMIRS